MALASAKGLIRSEVGKQLGMRHVPTMDFIHDALPETARHIDDLLERVRESDAAAAQSANAGAYAGEPDPYKKPRDPVDPDDCRPDVPATWTTRTRGRRGLVSPERAALDPGQAASWSSTSRAADLARRGGPGTTTGRHPQGGSRRHPRPDGDRRARARCQPGHPVCWATCWSPTRCTTPPSGSARPPRPTTPRVRSIDRLPTVGLTEERILTGAERVRRRRSTRCPRRSRRSRSTVAAPTSGSRAGEQVQLASRRVRIDSIEVHGIRLGPGRRRRRRLGALLERHLHPCDRPRPRRPARHRWTPDRTASYGGRTVRARRRRGPSSSSPRWTRC